MTAFTPFDWRSAELWYVNLPHRVDRDAHARQQFQRQGLTARRFEGFKPEECVGWSDDPKIQRMKARTPGAIGCQQSQLHCVRTVQGSEDRIVGIFEDDAVLCEDFKMRLDYIQDHLEAASNGEWDIFWLGGTVHINPPIWYAQTPGRETAKADIERTSDKHIFRVFGMWSTYAYFVNGRSVRRILELCDQHTHESDGIDHLAILYLEPQLRTFCFLPGCCKQIDGVSDIGTVKGGGPGFTTFSHFAKLGPYWYQERMEDFDPDTLTLP